MQKAYAIALLLATSLGLVTPLLALESAEADLPACCRRDGNHHCAMKTAKLQASAPDGPVLAAASHCPFYPTGSLAPAHAKYAMATDSTVHAFALAACGTARFAHTAFLPRLESPAGSERGPPVLLS